MSSHFIDNDIETIINHHDLLSYTLLNINSNFCIKFSKILSGTNTISYSSFELYSLVLDVRPVVVVSRKPWDI